MGEENQQLVSVAELASSFPKPARSGTSSTPAPTRVLGGNVAPWDQCFVAEMHRRAMESDIIIVNHHLFFADLAINQQADGAPDAGILPEAGAVIFDEAHELEDVAGNYFGISVSAARLEELCRDVEGSLQRNRMYTTGLSGALKSLRDRSGFFFSLLPEGEGRFAFENRREFLEENGEEFLGLAARADPHRRRAGKSSVEAGGSLCTSHGGRRSCRFSLASRWNRKTATRCSGSRDRRTGREKLNVSLQATPIDVGPVLRNACGRSLIPWC